MTLADLLIRLEPQPAPDWPDAVEGRIHDPVWFLARQWQLGEFQGENASTPVKAEITVVNRPIRFEPGPADVDDSVQTAPAEAVIESETDDWWTIGRRIRAGRAAARGRELPDDPSLRLDDPPPPYDVHRGAWDGLALWRRRGADDLDIPSTAFGETPPAETPSLWNGTAMVYEQDDVFSAKGVALNLKAHRGGRVDWYSVDAVAQDQAGLTDESTSRIAIPSRIHYPGMPLRGLWEIEDTATDIGATPADSSHTATAMMTELFFSHRDEWFDIPVGGTAGTIVTLDRVAVTDDFGRSYDSAAETDGTPEWPGLQPPKAREPHPDGDSDWSLFRTVGLAPNDLLLWHVAEFPLGSDPVERVQFGIDDESNLLWAVERRLNARDVIGRTDRDGAVPGAPHNSPIPSGDFLHGKSYTYVPGRGAEPHWIPYTLDTTAERWEFVQRRLADYSVEPPALMPLAAASVLTAEEGVHRIVASAMPTSGIEVERRWQLARDSAGRPVLWIQRQRRPLTAPPARRLRFDIAEPTGAEPTP